MLKKLRRTRHLCHDCADTWRGAMLVAFWRFLLHVNIRNGKVLTEGGKVATNTGSETSCDCCGGVVHVCHECREQVVVATPTFVCCIDEATSFFRVTWDLDTTGCPSTNPPCATSYHTGSIDLPWVSTFGANDTFGLANTPAPWSSTSRLVLGCKNGTFSFLLFRDLGGGETLQIFGEAEIDEFKCCELMVSPLDPAPSCSGWVRIIGGAGACREFGDLKMTFKLMENYCCDCYDGEGDIPECVVSDRDHCVEPPNDVAVPGVPNNFLPAHPECDRSGEPNCPDCGDACPECDDTKDPTCFDVASSGVIGCCILNPGGPGSGSVEWDVEQIGLVRLVKVSACQWRASAVGQFDVTRKNHTSDDCSDPAPAQNVSNDHEIIVDRRGAPDDDFRLRWLVYDLGGPHTIFDGDVAMAAGKCGVDSFPFVFIANGSTSCAPPLGDKIARHGTITLDSVSGGDCRVC